MKTRFSLFVAALKGQSAGNLSAGLEFVAQTSKSAVSQVSQTARAGNRSGRGNCSDAPPTWKSAIQQVWKPALRSRPGWRIGVREEVAQTSKSAVSQVSQPAGVPRLHAHTEHLATLPTWKSATQPTWKSNAASFWQPQRQRTTLPAAPWTSEPGRGNPSPRPHGHY